jgi:hypothetical protein
MKGLELSRNFYLTYGKAALEDEFQELMPRLAVGLAGEGSECFGFDDGVSRDHDFEPGFCMWISEEDEREFGFRLFRAYSRLPREYMGIKLKEGNVLAESYKGVITISDFYRRYTGREGAPETLEDWLYTPSHYLAEATNGEVFFDPKGDFTRVREEILHSMPRDVKLKKIASCAFYMAQAGQYNFSRCLAHGENGAARLALSDFVRNAAEMAFLLNDKHMPYYKWAFRAMRDLPILGDSSAELQMILDTPNSQSTEITDVVERYCENVAKVLKGRGYSVLETSYLEMHAYSVNECINNHKLRNMPVML